MSAKKLVVIGGGAAGFFCAVNAARLHPGLQVTIIEKSSKLLAKVKVSGGGRCNVTHACYSIPEMIRHYPRGSSFLKHAFHHFFTTGTISWFRERGVQLKTEADGRMFPESNSAQTIIDCMLDEATKYDVKIIMNAEVKSFDVLSTEKPFCISPEEEMAINRDRKRFTIRLSNGRIEEADYICLAVGGYPKSAQFEWLARTGHTLEMPVPSLFTFNLVKNKITALMGIAVENVLVKITGTKLQQSGPVLITHWGMSGPAVLRLSAWAARELHAKNYEYAVMINWLPEYNENSLKARLLQIRFELASRRLYNKNPFSLPARLWEYLLNETGIPEDMRWADLPAKEQNKLVKILCSLELDVKGKTTFKEEFVTAGGIRTEEVDAHTMQSKLMPGLFFAGEVLNIDGVTGGFNFQNAWTTGWIAAKGIGC